MVNETLCKVLAHNLCVLIQEQCELGIEAEFWAEKPAALPPVVDAVDVQPVAPAAYCAESESELDFAELAFV